MATNDDDSIEEADDLYKKGKYAAAISLYEKTIDESSAKESLLSYAESLRLTNNCPKALDVYDQILSSDSNYVAAIEGKGLCKVVQGKFQDAVELLSHVVRSDSAKWRSINALGVIYALNGHMDESMEYYNLAIQSNGHNPSILNNIGLSLAFSGDYQRGTTILGKSLSLVKSSDTQKIKRIEMNLALIYGLAGQTEQAQEILEKHFSKAEVMNNLGFYASLANDAKLAKSYLAKALSISPSHYEKAWNNLNALDTSG